MRKFVILITILAMLFSFGGCSKPKEQSQNNNTNTPTPQNTEDKRASIGGLHLGDSKEDVIKALGTRNSETFEEDPGFLGEPYYKWFYDRGVMVIVGKNTGKIFHIETTDSTLPTNLGMKVGDTYEAVNNKYSSYKTYVSNQDNSKLTGWYVTDNETITMFDFNKDDNAIVNFNVKPDSKVEVIRLTYETLID